MLDPADSIQKHNSQDKTGLADANDLVAKPLDHDTEEFLGYPSPPARLQSPTLQTEEHVHATSAAIGRTLTSHSMPACICMGSRVCLVKIDACLRSLIPLTKQVQTSRSEPHAG